MSMLRKVLVMFFLFLFYLSIFASVVRVQALNIKEARRYAEEKLPSLKDVAGVSHHEGSQRLITYTSSEKSIITGEIKGEKEQFKFVNVTLIVKDVDGTPLNGVEVKAFSEDWGLSFPQYWFSISDNNGVVVFWLPAGNYSFFAGGGLVYSQNHPGQGYFAMLKHVQLMNNSTLVLQPDSVINVSIFDVYGQPLNGQVRMMDSHHVPIVITPLVGLTDNGQILLRVTSGNTYHIAFSGCSSSGACYVLLQKYVPSGSQITIRPRSQDLAHLIIKL